jgi:L-amino acid N-acyltransferase YncA
MSIRLTAADITICACEEDHVAAITTIYAHHVLHGLASFEVEPPSENDMRGRLDIVSHNYPYLVAACAGEVVGYAYASPYRLRPAYRHTAENSVYLHPAWASRGIGRQLMSALLAECEARGVRQIVAASATARIAHRSASIRASAFARLAFSVQSGSNLVAGLTAC